jgi:hypothetical protein
MTQEPEKPKLTWEEKITDIGSAKQVRIGGAKRRPSLPYKSFPF